MTRSAIYFGTVTHERFVGPRHRFRYPAALFLLDLAELPELDTRSRLFGWNRRRPVAFRDRDHLGDPQRAASENVRTFVEAHGEPWPGGRVLLLTNCRLFGYVFNPLSLFYCYDTAGTLALVVAEVNNTFGDRHAYLLPASRAQRATAPGAVGPLRLSWREKKAMHVSPFLSLDGTYAFTLEPPSDRVRARIDLAVGDVPQLSATLALEAPEPIDDRAVALMLLRYPLETIKVIGAIHWEALRLWRKGAPFRSRPPYDPEAARRRPA
jgi:DUF1365 family protein